MFKEYVKYIKDNPQHYWFKRKLYGWGWTPATWEGWLVILGYTAAILLLAFTVDNSSPSEEIAFTFVIPILLLTATLIGICYKTGEKPKWQWGKKPPLQ